MRFGNYLIPPLARRRKQSVAASRPAPYCVLLVEVYPTVRSRGLAIAHFFTVWFAVARTNAVETIKTRREKAVPAARSAGASDGTERVGKLLSCSRRRTDGFSRERFVFLIMRLPWAGFLAFLLDKRVKWGLI